MTYCTCLEPVVDTHGVSVLGEHCCLVKDGCGLPLSPKPPRVCIKCKHQECFYDGRGCRDWCDVVDVNAGMCCEGKCSYTTPTPQKGWRNEEPWVSIEGVLWDVKNGGKKVNVGMEQIKEYVSLEVAKAERRGREEAVEYIRKELPNAVYVEDGGYNEQLWDETLKEARNLTK